MRTLDSLLDIFMFLLICFYTYVAYVCVPMFFTLMFIISFAWLGMTIALIVFRIKEYKLAKQRKLKDELLYGNYFDLEGEK